MVNVSKQQRLLSSTISKLTHLRHLGIDVRRHIKTYQCPVNQMCVNAPEKLKVNHVVFASRLLLVSDVAVERVHEVFSAPIRQS